MNKISFLIILITLVLSSCCDECCYDQIPCKKCRSHCIPEKVSNRKYNNVQIILDLSDRLNDINQKSRDIKILNGLFDAFTSKITATGYNNGGLWKSKDIFKVILASQNSTDSLKLKYELVLTTDYRSIPDSLKAKGKDARIIDFQSNVNKLYTTKIQHIGSNVSVDLKNSEMALQDTLEYNNIIILITDGEDDNFESEISGINLSTASIFIIEINNPSNNWNDLKHKEDKIKKYFQNSSPIPVKSLNNKISPNEIIREIFNLSLITKPSNEDVKNKKKINEKDDTEIKKGLVATNQDLEDVLNQVDTKIHKTNELCEQTEYTNLKIKISGYRGQEVTDDQIQQFKAEINDVAQKCREAN